MAGFRGCVINVKAVSEDSPYVEVEKVSSLVLYLCSDAGEIVNGACWTADAGTTAN